MGSLPRLRALGCVYSCHPWAIPFDDDWRLAAKFATNAMSRFAVTATEVGKRFVTRRYFYSTDS